MYQIFEYILLYFCILTYINFLYTYYQAYYHVFILKPCCYIKYEHFYYNKIKVSILFQERGFYFFQRVRQNEIFFITRKVCQNF